MKVVNYSILGLPSSPFPCNMEKEYIKMDLNRYLKKKELVDSTERHVSEVRFFINQCHMSTLILGPGGGDQSHTTDEPAGVDALIQAAQIFGSIPINYLSGKNETQS
jgi:acetylornithine deacetylase/succinyl-diaminopimelate desuccinylase-like protein